jgi:hypothetical protein
MEEFIAYFSVVCDQRRDNVRRNLYEVLIIGLCTMLRGPENSGSRRRLALNLARLKDFKASKAKTNPASWNDRFRAVGSPSTPSIICGRPAATPPRRPSCCACSLAHAKGLRAPGLRFARARIFLF